MENKVALITGASSGIGLETAKAFARKGVKVSLAARREKELRSLVSEIEKEGGTATFIQTDVSNSSDVQRMVKHTVDTFGQLDFAVNNAGIEGEFASILNFPEEEWERVIAINLKGAFLSMKYEALAMIEQESGGSIVNVGSVNSFLGFAGGTGYATSKHGMIGLTTSASAELASKNIRVNIVCPGVIDTPMHQRIRGVVGDDRFEDLLLSVHQKRAGLPEEIANSIVFLCSPEASYITGTTLTPDGGFTSTL